MKFSLNKVISFNYLVNDFLRLPIILDNSLRSYLLSYLIDGYLLYHDHFKLSVAQHCWSENHIPTSTRLPSTERILLRDRQYSLRTRNIIKKLHIKSHIKIANNAKNLFNLHLHFYCNCPCAAI